MTNQKEPKVWFITGASRGFGRIWTEATLQRSDKAAATARKLSSLAHLTEKYGGSVLTLELDVTNKEQVSKAVNEAFAHFGRLDVVLNNAGYSLAGTILSDVLRSLTGQNAQQYLHGKLIEKAKEKLSTTSLSVSEIAFGLGFEHSQSFSKLFKSKTAQSPLEFRSAFN